MLKVINKSKTTYKYTKLEEEELLGLFENFFSRVKQHMSCDDAEQLNIGILLAMCLAKRVIRAIALVTKHAVNYFTFRSQVQVEAPLTIARLG